MYYVLKMNINVYFTIDNVLALSYVMIQMGVSWLLIKSDMERHKMEAFLNKLLMNNCDMLYEVTFSIVHLLACDIISSYLFARSL